MPANLLKYKLKEQKTFADRQQSPVSSREALSRSRSAATPGDSAAEAGRLVVPAVSWWDQQPLSEVEGLWAMTVASALQDLQQRLVPELPEPSAVKPTAAMLDQPWCELSQEAAPFPEPSPPSPEVSSSPEPPDRTQQHPSEQPQPAPAPPKSQLQPRDKTASLGGLSSRVQPPPPARAGPSGVVRVEEGRKEPERGVKRQFFPEQPRAAEAVEEEEEVQKKRLEEAAAGGGGGLQSCPMCLLVFPAGFTQMERDGHLAQCLSEVNMDVTW